MDTDGETGKSAELLVLEVKGDFREEPLSPTTMARILVGLERFCGASNPNFKGS